MLFCISCHQDAVQWGECLSRQLLTLGHCVISILPEHATEGLRLAKVTDMETTGLGRDVQVRANLHAKWPTCFCICLCYDFFACCTCPYFCFCRASPCNQSMCHQSVSSLPYLSVCQATMLMARLCSPALYSSLFFAGRGFFTKSVSKHSFAARHV